MLSLILRHPTMQAYLDELKRSAPLRLLIGVFNQMVKRLGLADHNLGQHTAGANV